MSPRTVTFSEPRDAAYFAPGDAIVCSWPYTSAPRWMRLLQWAIRIRSPSSGEAPTLREAWTGVREAVGEVVRVWPSGAGAAEPARAHSGEL